MATDVRVKIDLSKPIGGIGFGIPLLLTIVGEEGTAVAYTECYSLEDVAKAGFAAESEMYKYANAIFMQNNRPEKIAICASQKAIPEAIADVIARDWRQLIVVGATTTDYTNIAKAIEATEDKMWFVSISKADFANFNVEDAGKRTVVFVNSNKYAAAALVGETAGRFAGSFTYKFKTLKGITAEEFTDAELAALHEKHAFAYVTKAGDDTTSEGFAADGTYIDETDSIDYVVQNVRYRVQKVLNSNAKVPYDDTGIALLDAAATSALQEAGENGIIAKLEDGSYDYTVSFGNRSETDASDRAKRIYKRGAFKFSLAGAIHDVEVTGEIEF